MKNNIIIAIIAGIIGGLIGAGIMYQFHPNKSEEVIFKLHVPKIISEDNS